MKHLPYLGTLLAALPLLVQPLSAQSTVVFRITPGHDLGRISPYVYGSNGHSDDRDENVTARRAGGNRWTGYNWENNASNAGEDYLNHSDNYLTQDLPADVQNTPGIAIRAFHDTSLTMGAYSLITLPAAGYVARDKKGTVTQLQTAPSSRWCEVVPFKPGPLRDIPDTADGRVSVDEEVAFLVGRYRSASTATGIRGYSIDNEPALWPSTHPRIHPARTTVAEVIERGISVAQAVKGVDPAAEVFGPVAYGFSEYMTMQDAPDWEQYRSYGTFVNAYLDAMRAAGATSGMRLLDVLDLHWYPEAQGRDANGNLVRIAFSERGDSGVAAARMQAPRSLWDSSYREESWIGTWFSPIALIPAMQASIDRYYPGTKLAFTELNYGGSGHVSGGIAMADVLGIFGRYGVYMSNHWGALDGYVSSAYRLFRNYDGKKSTFGSYALHASTSDVEASSVYASRDSADPAVIHIVALNKSLSRSIDASIDMSGVPFRILGIYGFDGTSPEIRRLDSGATAPALDFDYTMAPTSAIHIVAEVGPLPSSVHTAPGPDASAPPRLSVAPNPAASSLEVRFRPAARGYVSIMLVDHLGRDVRAVVDGDYEEGEQVVRIDRGALPAGTYMLRMVGPGGEATVPVTILR